MTAPLFTVQQSGPSVLLTGMHRDLLIEPFGQDEWAVSDPLTGDVVETTRDRADAFDAAVTAVLEG